jgi:hypothetical protein
MAAAAAVTSSMASLSLRGSSFQEFNGLVAQPSSARPAMPSAAHGNPSFPPILSKFSRFLFPFVWLAGVHEVFYSQQRIHQSGSASGVLSGSLRVHSSLYDSLFPLSLSSSAF